MSTNFEDLIMRDTRANQPAAGVPGRLYFVTDENVTERDNGATWDDISDAGSAGSVAADAIWDAKGDLAGGTGSNTAARLAVGANGTRLQADSGETTGMKWSDVGTLLGINIYNPGTAANTAASGSYADVDATNMKVTFTAPVSGNVIVVLSAYTLVNNSTLGWGLRESTTDLIGARAIETNASSNILSHVTTMFYLSGISGGSHTYKWSHKQIAGSSAQTRYGGTTDEYGPAVMQVFAAP